MPAVNFRTQDFQGTLRELLEETKTDIGNSLGNFLQAHQWLRQQLLEKDNVLPIRTFGTYRSRGTLHPYGANSSCFMPADNEPLASLYQHWINIGQIPLTLGSALRKGLVVASWRCDEPSPSTKPLRFKGVKATFRDRGLKLAHINDAAFGLSTGIPLEQQLPVRFLRSLSPLNVFLFPSIRCCDVRVVSTRGDFGPKKTDWAEDAQLKGVALGWLLDWAGKPLLDVLPDFGSPRIEPRADWRQVAEGTVVQVTPRGIPKAKSQTQKAQRTSCEPKKILLPSVNTVAKACPKISKEDAVSVEQAVEILREWRRSVPNATRLDGRVGKEKKNGNEHWLHIRVDGYGDHDRFVSRYGPVFDGKDYNGIVNFHADTKTNTIDHLIELLDEADDYRDVLRPSATFETKTRRSGAGVRPKFALQGYEDNVEGFFLYHDDWRPLA